MDLIKNAGVVAIPLLICSVLSLAIVFERLYSLMRLRRIETDAYEALSKADSKSWTDILRDPAYSAAPVAAILASLLPLAGTSQDTIAQAADIALAMQRVRLRRFLGTLATIGSTAPFVGLFGTVLGVMGAFKGMSQSGLSSDKMAGGISEALSATALGLLVAVPSVVAYNYFSGRVQVLLLGIQADIARTAPRLLAQPIAGRDAERSPSAPAARS